MVVQSRHYALVGCVFAVACSSKSDHPAVIGGAKDTGTTDATADVSTSDVSSDVGDGSADALYHPPPPPLKSAVAYQIDAAHTGAQPDGTLTVPLVQKWLVELGGAPTFPCVVEGKVFVAYAPAKGGAFVEALDEKTGTKLWGPADAGGTGHANITCGGGNVYAMHSSGQLTAFDGATGTQRWSTKLKDESDFDDPPTAWGQFVFTGGDGSGGVEYAYVAATGLLAWQRSTNGSSGSSPAVGPEGVFFGYSCGQDWNLDPISGAIRWHNSPGCDGGGGSSPVLYGGKAYFRDHDGNIVFDAYTGKNEGTFTADYAPAFASDVGYFVSGNTLTARALGAATPTWTFTPAGTSEKLVTAPIVVAGHVVVASDVGAITGDTGKVYVLAVASGAVESSVTVPTIAAGEKWPGVNGPLPGLIAGDDMLFVPTTTGLAAY